MLGLVPRDTGPGSCCPDARLAWGLEYFTLVGVEVTVEAGVSWSGSRASQGRCRVLLVRQMPGVWMWSVFLDIFRGIYWSRMEIKFCGYENGMSF
jgi:hypothetical protein